MRRHLLWFLVLHVVLQWRSAAQGLVNSTTPNAPQVRGPPRTPTRVTQSPVKLNKCCREGEYLDALQACVAGSSKYWVPRIFYINRKTYFMPQGEAPKHMSFLENVRPIAKETPATLSNDTIAPECAQDELELFKDNIVLFSNGSLLLLERAQLIEPQRFCVDQDAALVCFPPQASTPRLKLRKCCGKYGSYDPTTKSCHFSAGGNRSQDPLKLPVNESVYQTLYNFPVCPEGSTYVIAGDWREEHLHNETGHLKIQNKNLAHTEFCLEYLREAATDATDATTTKKPGTVKVFACLHHFAPTVPQNGVKSMGEQSDRIQVAALNVGLVISVVFLGATLVAGYMMPSVHHVLHWRCQIYYVFCLFVGDLLLAYSQLSGALTLGSPTCLLVASVMHFFFLSAFFWLNTMCFNIWWTFRDFRPSSLERNQELLRLRLYSAYAWGLPLLISAIAAIDDQLPDSQFLRPGFGERSCWFSGEHWSIFAYFYGPVGVLLCANIVLFVSTTHQLTCGLWKRDDVKSSSEKTALGRVCLKLVVVMGVTWFAEIVSWLIGGPHSAWFVTDLINALQGVFIFIVVGCQPQVWAACKRLCCPRLRQEITNTTNGVQHSSSSQGLPSMGACGGEVTQNTSINTTIGGAVHNQSKIPMETVC